MRIVKKTWAKPSKTFHIWTIPAFGYVFQKFTGMLNPAHDYMWWITISVFFILWLFMHFKIEN